MMMKIQKRNKNKNYGEPAPYDPIFNGPFPKRSFTDVFCCLIFIAAMIGYLILGVAAWLYGNPQYIIKEQNSTGAFCGVGHNINKRNVFYFDVLKCAASVNVTTATFKGLQCPTTQVCIEKCPWAFWFLPQKAFAAGEKPSDFFKQELCDPTLDLAQTTFTVQDILDKGLCPSYYMPSIPVQGKCLPSFDAKDVPSDFTVYGSTLGNKTIEVILNTSSSLRTGFNNKTITVRIVEDFAITWNWMITCLVIGLAVSMVLLLLMRCCVSLVAVLTIPGVLALVAYGIYYSYQQYTIHLNSELTLGGLGVQSQLSDYFQVKEIWLACMVILCLLEFILLMLFASCFRKGLSAALAVMRGCSKAMGVLPSTMVFPLVTFLLIMVCMTFFTATSINMMASGMPVFEKIALNTSSPDCSTITGKEKCVPETFKASDYPKCPVRCAFVHYDEDEGFFQRHARYLQIYNFLSCLWCLHFIITLGQCTTARAFSSYYWSLSNPHNIRRSILCEAFCQTLRYHTGSMALGAIFVNMFQGIRFVLEYVDDVTKGGQKCCCWCFPLKIPLKCCFYFLDKGIKYFTRNTYIMIATYGDNFFTSAKNSHMLCGRNKARVLVVDRITDLLLFFERLLVVGAMGIFAFNFFNGGIFLAEVPNLSWLPVIVVMVGTYFIALGCFSVYSMGVDTFTLCIMDDLERNDGTLQRPYRSRTLMHILQRQKNTAV